MCIGAIIRRFLLWMSSAPSKGPIKWKFWISLGKLALRVVLVLWLLIGLYHFWRYGNAAYSEIYESANKQKNEAQDLWNNYCLAPGAPAERMYSDNCIGARQAIHSDVNRKAVLRWMEQHILRLPFFNLFKVEGFERVVDVVVGVISVWNVLKAILLGFALKYCVVWLMPVLVEFTKVFQELRHGPPSQFVPIVNPLPKAKEH